MFLWVWAGSQIYTPSNKGFRDEIKEAFGLGHGKEAMGEIFEETQRRESDDEKEFKGESDGDNDLEENSEDSEADLGDPGDDNNLGYFKFEEELGYAPLQYITPNVSWSLNPPLNKLNCIFL